LQDLLHSHGLERVNFDVAQGMVHIEFSSRKATITFVPRKPGVTWDGRKPYIDFT